MFLYVCAMHFQFAPLALLSITYLFLVIMSDILVCHNVQLL